MTGTGLEAYALAAQMSETCRILQELVPRS
jgi:hypothetical protein